MLPESVYTSQAVATLGHAAFRILVLLAGCYNGKNNGALGLSKNQAARQGISARTLYRELKVLEEHGLIDFTYGASRTPPRPTMYAITWQPVNDTNYSVATRVASNDYRKFQAPRKIKRQGRKQLRVVK